MSQDFREAVAKQDKALASRIGQSAAHNIIETLPDYLAFPWAYGGAGDTFNRRETILDLLDERAKVLERAADHV